MNKKIKSEKEKGKVDYRAILKVCRKKVKRLSDKGFSDLLISIGKNPESAEKENAIEELIMLRYDVRELTNPQEKKKLATIVVDKAFKALYNQFPLYKEANLTEPVIEVCKNSTLGLSTIQSLFGEYWPKVKSQILILDNVANTIRNSHIQVYTIRDEKGKLIEPRELMDEICEALKGIQLLKLHLILTIIFNEYYYTISNRINGIDMEGVNKELAKRIEQHTH